MADASSSPRAVPSVSDRGTFRWQRRRGACRWARGCHVVARPYVDPYPGFCALRHREPKPATVVRSRALLKSVSARSHGGLGLDTISSVTVCSFSLSRSNRPVRPPDSWTSAGHTVRSVHRVTSFHKSHGRGDTFPPWSSSSALVPIRLFTLWFSHDSCQLTAYTVGCV